jgi:DNA-binding transcriptional ArsR family regulator
MRTDARLDRTFRALGAATRRAILHELAKGKPRSAGELGRHFRSAQPTISKHIKALEEAGLIERSVEGRLHWFRLRQDGLHAATRWLTRHRAFWEGAMDRLQVLVEGN